MTNFPNFASKHFLNFKLSDDELEDQYESIPAYEAPHKRDEDRDRRDRRKRKKGMQYPDPEFDRRWEKKRRDAEEQKQKDIDEKRRKREEERARRFSRYDDEDDYYSDDDRSQRNLVYNLNNLIQV